MAKDAMGENRSGIRIGPGTVPLRTLNPAGPIDKPARVRAARPTRIR